MRKITAIKTFTDRYPLIGPAIWILSVQYFIIQIITALAFRTTYSLRFNTISDLGNSACGNYSSRYVCSPQHNLMNASFILLGLTMASGSLLIYQGFKRDRVTLMGFGLMAIAGFGTLIVGLFPENTISFLHIFGASLPFLLGNAGLVILSISLNIPRLLRYYTFLTGVIALIALVFFYTGHYLSLGLGGMERLVAYPQTFWLIVFGVYISSNHIIKKSRSIRS
ncbi:MAG TPA: DUF998 domain-containing protein [Candidatus Dormibacteraeota bacterium]|nr:DUF998 domain-containing protein [Candidatus Dormibacteraeota bacterium]